MSFGRKKYDGDFFRRSDGSVKRGTTFDRESTVNKHAASKRAAALDEYSEIDNPYQTDDSDKDRYLITYADLITLLLGLFIILYAISNIDANKYQKMVGAIESIFGGKEKVNVIENIDPKIIPTQLDQLRTKLTKLITETNAGGSISLAENKRGLILHIKDDILFPSGSADLNPSSREMLNSISDILRNIPNDIRVEGHTDDVPINSKLYPSNWHLSVARALNTAYYLINERNLSPDKVSIVGYSKYKPISENSSVQGRSKNRRVDIVIIKR